MSSFGLDGLLRSVSNLFRVMLLSSSLKASLSSHCGFLLAQVTLLCCEYVELECLQSWLLVHFSFNSKFAGAFDQSLMFVFRPAVMLETEMVCIRIIDRRLVPFGTW